MFVQLLEGFWFLYLFWKIKFLFIDLVDLKVLQDSGVLVVLIDISKGDDVEVVVLCVFVVVQIQVLLLLLLVVFWCVMLVQELEQVVVVVNCLVEVVSLMFGEVWMGCVVDVQQCLLVVDEVVGFVNCNFGVLISLVCLKIKDNYIYMYLVVVCVLMVVLVW